MSSLYEQSEKLDQAMAGIDEWIATNQEAIAANGGEIPKEVYAEYDKIMKEQKDSIVWNAKRIQEYEAEQQMIGLEVRRLDLRAKAIERKREWRERMLFDYLQREGIDEVKNPLVTVKIKLNPPRVNFPLWSQLELGALWASPEYDWCVVRKDPEYRLDLNKIKEQWRALRVATGEPMAHDGKIPEGITVVQDKSLSIK